jgi:nicotinamidase/pyrazinamidase
MEGSSTAGARTHNSPKPKDARAIRALIVIDVQNDFIDGGLAVPNALDVIPVINRLRAKEFDFVYVCLDWHPYNHCSFRSNNPSKNVFEMVNLPAMGGPQMMWPDHCIQGSHGAKLHKDIQVEDSDIYTVAGCNPRFDSYSVFRDNNLKTLAELRDSLEANKVTEIYAAGLATDYCVQYTVLDAKILTEAKVFVVEDGCKGIDPAGVQLAFKAFDYEKIQVISSTGARDLLGCLYVSVCVYVYVCV